MNALQEKVQNQPATVAGSLQAFVNAVFFLLITFDVIQLTELRITAVSLVLNAGFSLLSALWVNRMTTSRANPTDSEGRPLVPKKPITRGLDDA